MKKIHAGGHALEILWFGAPPDAAPTIAFLHEGLGSAAMWRDFPARVAERTGCGALVWSRAGYGKSDPVTLPRPLDYMEREGESVVGEVLDACHVREAILVGHSDGASIAIVHAARDGKNRVRGVVLEAPHVFNEDLSVASIAKAKVAYETGDLRERLRKWHGDNVDVAFRGWNDAWLDPGFRAWNIEGYLPDVKVPMLVIQGADDEYGTMAQVEAIERGAGGPVERVVLKDCGHSPHRDQRDATEDAIAGFVRRVGAGPLTRE